MNPPPSPGPTMCWTLRGALAAWLALSAGCVGRLPVERALMCIAFGSCVNTQAHPRLDRTLDLPFDLFILLGDNIYADTTNMVVIIAEKYRVRNESAWFQALRKKAPVLATWDDHDFGWNDAGANYPRKVESQKLFCGFMDVPADPPRRQRPGIYDAPVFGPTTAGDFTRRPTPLTFPSAQKSRF